MISKTAITTRENKIQKVYF